MAAHIINLQPRDKSPEQTIAHFLKTHKPAAVKLLLWEIFKGYALNGPKTTEGECVKEVEIATLLDDISNLVDALAMLLGKEANH